MLLTDEQEVLGAGVGSLWAGRRRRGPGRQRSESPV